MTTFGRWKRVGGLMPVLLLAVLHAGCQQLPGMSTSSNYPPGMGQGFDPFGAPRPSGMMPNGSPYSNLPATPPGSLVQTQFTQPADHNPLTGAPMSTGPGVPGSMGLIKPGSSGPYVKPLEGANDVFLQPGCNEMPQMPPMPQSGGPLPTELAPVSLAPYTVAPPDILVIDAGPLFPLTYAIQPFDVLTVLAFIPSTPGADADPTKKGLKEALIAGDFKVTPEGKLILPIQGSPTAITVKGLTVEQANIALSERLKLVYKVVDVLIELKTFRPIAQFQKAPYLVRPDGTIGLGSYGYVYVAGMTLGQVKTVVEKHLSQYVSNPVISVDVAAYNSKKYYLIIDGGGYGQLVFAYPYTGNEMVLDAVSRLSGLPWWASKKNIWVARPAPCGHPCAQILPVDWNAITQGGRTCTNWQLMPGDRVYVRADCLVEVNNWITKVLSPINQVLNSTLLGASTWETIRFPNGNNNSGVIRVLP